MNILETLLADDNKGALDEIARNFNLNEEQTRAAMKELVPPLTRGLNKNTSNQAGLDDLLDALEKGSHGSYIDQPDKLSKSETVEDGNDILGHIFGNKEVSRTVAKTASERSGLSSTLLKKMLPIIASLAMGALSKGLLGGQSRRGNNRAASGGLLGTLLRFRWRWLDLGRHPEYGCQGNATIRAMLR